MRAELSQAGIEFIQHDFFKSTLDAGSIRQLLAGESPRVLFNFKSVAFKKSGLSQDLSDEQLIELLSEEPRYFRRPVLVVDGKIYPGVNVKQCQAIFGS